MRIVQQAHGAQTSPPLNFTKADAALMIEALTMASSRHESMSAVTQSRFRDQHTYKARRMRELRDELSKWQRTGDFG
jgi:hypothetical protein